MLFLRVCLCLPCPERLHRRSHPQNIPHKPGRLATGHGVHAVRLHRAWPGNHLNRRVCVSQSEGKEEETLACLLVFLTACCRVGMWPTNKHRVAAGVFSGDAALLFSLAKNRRVQFTCITHSYWCVGGSSIFQLVATNIFQSLILKPR